MTKKTIHDFNNMVETGEKIVYLTAYDYLTAKMEEKAGVDMILVGDSLGMVSLGYDTTFPVTMDDMIRHFRLYVVAPPIRSLLVTCLTCLTKYRMN